MWLGKKLREGMLVKICAPVAQMDQSGRFLNGKSRSDSEFRNCMSDGLSPIEIIAKGRWDNALFTTYALSLTFFETHLIKNCLVKTGCRNIWVVADVDGYQQSLAERQSARVGQEYHLVPVALPNGVFHPKCSYLSGPDGDLLMVSSGNLTFGGFGRNVEVIEMFHSRQNPGVFRQFSEFLQALNERKDFLNPDNQAPDLGALMAKLDFGTGHNMTPGKSGGGMLEGTRNVSAAV